MTEIGNFFTRLFATYQPPSGGAAPAPSASKGASKGQGAGDPLPAERTVRDTVELSEGGQKIINLARGREFAKEIRTTPVDKDFAAKLAKALEDIFRITRLFTATIKMAFLGRHS